MRTRNEQGWPVRPSGKFDLRFQTQSAALGVSSLYWSDRRRAVGMERLDRLQAPGLALLALLLGPHDRFPVRRQDEAGAGVGDLDPIAARLVDIEEEGLLDGVFVRTGLDVDAVLLKDVGGAQHVLAAVERIGDVMETAGLAEVVARI